MPDKLTFWTLSAEIDDYLTRGDGITQTGLLRLLQQCQAVARELWTDEANATLALEERDTQIAELKAQIEMLSGKG